MSESGRDLLTVKLMIPPSGSFDLQVDGWVTIEKAVQEILNALHLELSCRETPVFFHLETARFLDGSLSFQNSLIFEEEHLLVLLPPNRTRFLEHV